MKALAKTRLLAVAVNDKPIVQPRLLLALCVGTWAISWLLLHVVWGFDHNLSPSLQLLPTLAVAFACLSLQFVEWLIYIFSPAAKMADSMFKGRNHHLKPEQYQAMKKFVEMAGKNPMAQARSRPMYD